MVVYLKTSFDMSENCSDNLRLDFVDSDNH